MSVPGLFTHGSPRHHLPHPVIPTRLLLVAHAAFVQAFTMLRAAPPVGFVLVMALLKGHHSSTEGYLSERSLT